MGVRRFGRASASEYTVSYSGMHGVDFSPDSSANKRYRFSHLENMYRDYEGGGAGITESIPGFRRILSLGKRINGIFSHKSSAGEEYIVVHAESSLYRFAVSERDAISRISEIAKLENTKSSSFTSGCDLYIIDGAGIVRINGEGEASYVSDSGGAAPYIPTTYYNGEEYEQRNLLTNRFREKYRVSASADVAAESEGLKFRIVSVEKRICAVTGIEEGYGGTVYIPAYADISGVRYKVQNVDNSAFYMNNDIVRIVLPETTVRIGRFAFYNCQNLTEVITRSAINNIDTYAFASCPALKSVYLGLGIVAIAQGVFSNCPSLKTIYYALSEEIFSNVYIEADLSNITIQYNTFYNANTIEIPLLSPTESVLSVTKNGESVGFSTKIEGALIKSVIISSSDISELDGKEFTVHGIMSDTAFTKNSTGTDFFSENAASVSGFDAITKCRVCESFDGRVFLSGNPELPNTVFYTARDGTGRNNPLYFGVLNYFNDGIGSFTVESMLASGEALAVFKSGDDGCGSIYYHTPKATGADIMPVIYPISYVHSGIYAKGESISFFDDPIFLSSLGVSALGKRNINLERSISVRSHNINSRLLADDLSKISMTKWCGYLVLAAGDHIYLGDSRDTFTHETGNTEYEWYYLCGIGTYKAAENIFRYSKTAREGYLAHPDTDKEVSGKTYVAMDPSGELVYYAKENGSKYEIYYTGEKRGGTFSPVTVVYSTANDLLFFGTESGDICIFNNDKRGAPPEYLSLTEEEEAEYRRALGKRLHPSYYSFDNHAPRYAASSVGDNGGFPNLKKTTVKNSLTAKLRMIGGGSFTCEVGTEEKGFTEVASFPDGDLNFRELDFGALSFSNSEYVTLPFKEREKGWIEKQISFYSDKFESPFGICNITYRFKIKGKIKN